MSKLKIAHQVRAAIARNETAKAIRLLGEALNGHPAQDIVLVRAAQQQGLQKGILLGTIPWQDANLTQNQIHAALLQAVEQLVKEEISEIDVFISYNHDDASSKLAKAIHIDLKDKGFRVFMDVEDIPLGGEWTKTILHTINHAEYFILLLSEKANSSEMVIREVEEAYRLKKATDMPIILPIRVNLPLDRRLNESLHRMLHRTQQVEWCSEKDTPRILQQIMDVLYARVDLIDTEVADEQVHQFIPEEDLLPTPVAPLEVPRGAVRLESKYYIKRKQEDSFIKHIENPGSLLRIRGPRQFGKTSLLTRVIAYADEQEYDIVTIDFQEFEEDTMSDLDEFLWEFCSYFAEEFYLEDELKKRWERPRAKKQICTAFIEKDILRKRDKPLLLALDEADRLFNFPETSTEFFLLLRSWHEKSKVPNKRVWEKFRLVLSYSTEAKLAIRDLNASPFNVGEEAKLYPFTEAQVVDLTQRHALNWDSNQLQYIMQLLEGQPYLTRRAMYLLAKEEYTFEQLQQTADKHNGPFSDHLRHHLLNIRPLEDIVEAMRSIIERGVCDDPILATRLEATGLVKGSPPNVVPSNGLYASYFKEQL